MGRYRKAAFMRLSKMLLVLVVMLGISISNVFAWQTNHTAETYCDGRNVLIKVILSNTEPNQDMYRMNVTAKDLQTGESVSLGTVNPGVSVRAEINPKKEQIGAGTVEFNLTWTDGRSGTDKYYANYNAIECMPNQTVVPSVTPLATPTIAPTVQPSASPTVVPTNQPTVTPSVNPSASPSVSSSESVTSAINGIGGGDSLGCAVKDCSGNEVGRGGVVLGASTESILPSTGKGLNESLILGGMVMILGMVLVRKANRAENFLKI